MTATVYGIENTNPFYPGLDGLPLQNGRVWFGVAGQNPVTNPTSVYLDAAGTQPVAQPVAIASGRTVDQYGNPVTLYMPGDFSRLVQDVLGRQLLFQTSQPATQSGVLSQNWAQYTGGDVPGALAGSRSAKSWSQDDLSGASYGGSAKDWAQSPTLPDGVSKSAKSYAADALAQANAASGSAATAAAQASIATTASAVVGAYPNSGATVVPSGVASGSGYWVTSVDGMQLDHYKNVGGVATVDPTVASISSAPNINDLATRISSGNASGVYSNPLWRAPIVSWNQTDNVAASFTKAVSGSYTRLTPTSASTDGKVYTHSTSITIGGYRTRIRQVINAIDVAANGNSKVGIMLDDGTTKVAFLVEAASGVIDQQILGGALTSIATAGSGWTVGSNIDIYFDILHATGEVQVGYSVNGGPRYWAGFTGLSVNGQTLHLCNYQRYTYEHRLELESIGKISTPKVASTDQLPWEKLVARNTPPGWAPTHALPSDFRVYAINGKFASSYDNYPAPLTESDYCAIIYVDPVNGSDTAAGSSAAPLKSLQKAVLAGRYARKLLIRAKPGNYNTRALSFGSEDLKGLVCVIVPWGSGRIFSSPRFTGLVWTLNTGATWQANLAGITASFASVYDSGIPTSAGDNSALILQASIAAVDANPGSYFVSGGIVYVRTADGRQPDANVIVYDTFLGNLNYQVDGGILYAENIDQEGSVKGFFSQPPSPYTAVPTMVPKNCTGKYNTLDAIWGYSAGMTVAIGCTWAANNGDGASFGVAGPGGGSHLLIELGVTSRNNGVGGADQNSTAHSASTTVRINGTYTGQTGQAVADVQGSVSWMLGCTGAKGSITAEVFRSGNGAGGGGQMYLEGCTATGGAVDLVADTGATIYKNSFTGTGTTSGTVTNYTP